MSWFKTIHTGEGAGTAPESEVKKPWFKTIDTSAPEEVPEAVTEEPGADVTTEDELPKRPRFETVYTRPDVTKPE